MLIMNFKLSFVIAIALHLLLFSFIIWAFTKTTISKPVVNAYIFQRDFVQHADLGERLHNRLKLQTQSIKLNNKGNEQATITSVADASQSAGKAKNPPREIILLLHNKIQKALYYPLSAELLNEQGTVKVGFLMKSSGEIIKPKVVKTSGHRDLDEAAIQTLRGASPVDGVRKYLLQQKSFVINIQYYE